MAGLFGSGLGLGFNQGLGQSVGKSIGEGGLDEGTATSLALLNAMRQSQEAGLQRTATPIGSIAQNLMPLFGALIMGKAMAQQAAANQAAAAQEDVQNQAKLGLTQAQTENVQARTKALQNQPPPDQYKGVPPDVRVRMDPRPEVQDALRASEDAKNARAEIASGLITQRSNQLAQDAEQRRIETERRKPVDGVGGRYVFDPNTGERVVGAKQADVEDNGYVPLSRQDAQALGSAQIASKQLNELQRLGDKILPAYKDGLLTRAVTLGGNMAADAAANPDVKKFRMLSNFENLPEIQALTRRGILPQAMVKQLAKPSDLLDNKESAAAKIGAMRDMLSGVVHAMGIDPTGALEAYSPEISPSGGGGAGASGTPTPTATPIPAPKKAAFIPKALNVEVPDKYSDKAVEIFNSVAAAHGATAGAIAVQSWLRSQPQ